MFRLTFYPILDNALLLALLLIAFGAAVLLLFPSEERLTPRGRRVLVGLRLLALGFLCVAMLRPTLLYTESRRLASSVHLVLDRSESMSVADEVGGKSRYATAVDALHEAEPFLKTMQRLDIEVAAFAFDRALVPMNVKNGVVEGLDGKPTGSETALGYALDQILLRSGGKRILGTILLSDGTQRSLPPRDTLPQEAASRYHDASSPIFPVRLGLDGPGSAQDVAVIDLLANDRVFIRNELSVSGTVRVAGYINRPIPVHLLFEDENGQMQRVAEKEVMAREEGQIVRYDFKYTPPKIGLYKFGVEVPLQPKELVATNNAMYDFVRVVDGGLSVLYLQGEPRFEHRPFQQALDASKDIHVRTLRFPIEEMRRIARRMKRPLEKVIEEETGKRPSYRQEFFDAEEYTVFILDDLPAAALKAEELQALADRVRGGAGLIMLGGFYAFGAGGYDATPLKDVAPVVMSPLDRQPLDGAPREDTHLKNVRMLPSERGLSHPVMELVKGRAENEALWRKMPELQGANRFDALKAGATVLGQGPRGEHEPLLVSQVVGTGRVLAFAGDSTWRWVMHGFGEQQKRFWRKVILWLAKMDESGGGECWITLEKTRLYPNEAVSFQIFLKPGQAEETVPARAEARVVKPDGVAEDLTLVEVDGVPTGTIRGTEQPGDYLIQVRATERDAPAGTDENPWRDASARFMVFDRNFELDNPVAYPRLLENIAATTGGHTIAPEQISGLLEELLKRSDELIEKRETKRSLYDTWWLLLLFTATLSLEWFLRKKWGLV